MRIDRVEFADAMNRDALPILEIGKVSDYVERGSEMSGFRGPLSNGGHLSFSNTEVNKITRAWKIENDDAEKLAALILISKERSSFRNAFLATQVMGILYESCEKIPDDFHGVIFDREILKIYGDISSKDGKVVLPRMRICVPYDVGNLTREMTVENNFIIIQSSLMLNRDARAWVLEG